MLSWNSTPVWRTNTIGRSNEEVEGFACWEGNTGISNPSSHTIFSFFNIKLSSTQIMFWTTVISIPSLVTSLQTDQVFRFLHKPTFLILATNHTPTSHAPWYSNSLFGNTRLPTIQPTPSTTYLPQVTTTTQSAGIPLVGKQRPNFQPIDIINSLLWTVLQTPTSNNSSTPSNHTDHTIFSSFSPTPTITQPTTLISNLTSPLPSSTPLSCPSPSTYIFQPQEGIFGIYNNPSSFNTLVEQ